MKSIELQNGTKISLFPLPPADFRPAAASDTELTRYGLPGRPSDATLRAKYEQYLRRLSSKGFEFVEPGFRNINKPAMPGRHRRNRKPVEQGPFQSGSWTGAAVFPFPNTLDSFKWVTGSFVVPNVATAQNKDIQLISSHWIGIDDGSGADGSEQRLLQIGVICNATPKPEIYAFWEWLPGPPMGINIDVAAGDFVYFQICTPSGAGSTSATLTCTNFTSGKTISFGVAAPPGVTLIGNVAQWISEGAEGGQFLANFGEVYFGDCHAGMELGGVVNAGPAELAEDECILFTMYALDPVTQLPVELVASSEVVAETVVKTLYQGP